MAFKSGFSAKTDAAYKDLCAIITESMLNILLLLLLGI
jgi:hypothetical protein